MRHSINIISCSSIKGQQVHIKSNNKKLLNFQ
jgi:hypothetical protein